MLSEHEIFFHLWLGLLLLLLLLLLSLLLSEKFNEVWCPLTRMKIEENVNLYHYVTSFNKRLLSQTLSKQRSEFIIHGIPVSVKDTVEKLELLWVDGNEMELLKI